MSRGSKWDEFGLDDSGGYGDDLGGIDGRSSGRSLGEQAAGYTPLADLARSTGRQAGKSAGKQSEKQAKKQAGKKTKSGKPKPPEPLTYREVFEGHTSVVPTDGPHNVQRFELLTAKIYHQLTRDASPNFDAAVDLIQNAEREFCRERQRQMIEAEIEAENAAIDDILGGWEDD